MATSIKKNVIYSTLLAISLYLFPFLTFPYVTRVLGVNNLGICNYANGIIELFCIISMMGMTQLGIREIARSKHDKKKLSETFTSLILLNIITTIAAIAVLVILILFIPQFKEHKILLYIGIPKILFNTLLIEWLYKGLEDFKYVTIRSILVRSLYVLSIFIFVKTPDDYVVYFALSVFMVVLNASINIVYSSKFTSIIINIKSIRDYIKPFFKLGVYQLLTYMYTSFNVVFLGIVSGTTEVGYYTTAVKLYSVIIALFSAFTGAMMPRMSVYIEKNEFEKFYTYINHSIGILLLFSLPIVIIAEIYASEIIRLIAGPGYEGAILPMRIVFPLMIVIGLEQILIAQILIPLRKDNAILTNSIIGASVGILANLYFVPMLASSGSAITWVISEFAVLLSAQYFLKRDKVYIVDVKLILRYFLLAIPVTIVILILFNFFNEDFFVSVILMVICTIILYLYYVTTVPLKWTNRSLK